jgi:predicted component of type VI protein secretion system
MLRVTVTRDGRHQTYTLTKQTMEVGRGTGNDINLTDDTNISRDHGVIMWRRGRWYYANRKPQARVQVGGKTLKGFRMQELGDNTQIKIGDYTLVSHYDTEADPDSLLKTQF